MNGAIIARASQMEWLPSIGNFPQSLRAALDLESPQRRIEQLAVLAGHRLGMLEVQQLHRALGQVDSSAADGFSHFRVSLIGSATLNHLAPCIRVAGIRHRLLFDVNVGAYGQFRREALDPASSLRDFAPAIVLLSVTAHDLIGDISLRADEAEAEMALSRAVDDLRSIWRSIALNFKASVIQQTFLDINPSVFGSSDRTIPTAPARLVQVFNDRVAVAAQEQGVVLVDIAGQAQRDGLASWFDRRYWLYAKQEISPEAAIMYGELFARIVAAQYGRSRKCLALDLDNTLWGGVVGECGVEGIVLGPGSGEGEAYVALQHYAKQLKDRGVILAICSKNDPIIAEEAFRGHPEMLLKRADISAFVANWEDKAQNLKQIASKLNIGLDSIVFVDDNPVERARIREALPSVAVPELPDDPAYYASTIAAGGYFETVAFTREDKERSGFYAKEAERDALLSEAKSLDEFLSGLEMTVTYSSFEPTDLARVTQLINKTNQFNTTTRRYSAEQIASIAATANYITLQFRLADRLGDSGIVSTMIFAPVQTDPTAVELESWVMSCRVFGRELEYEAMNIAVEIALGRNARTIVATYRPTQRNRVIKDLYSRLGFCRIDSSRCSEGSACWQLDINRYRPHLTKITRRVLQ